MTFHWLSAMLSDNPKAGLHTFLTSIWTWQFHSEKSVRWDDLNDKVFGKCQPITTTGSQSNYLHDLISLAITKFASEHLGPSICQQTSISKQGIACNVYCCSYIPLFYEVLLRNMMYTALINGLSLDIGIYSIIIFPPCQPEMHSLIARFTGPTWGPYGADRTQVCPMLAPWTLLSGIGSPCCYLNPKSRLWHWLTKNSLFLR